VHNTFKCIRCTQCPSQVKSRLLRTLYVLIQENCGLRNSYDRDVNTRIDKSHKVWHDNWYRLGIGIAAVKVKVIPQQAEVAQGVTGKFKAPNFLDVRHYKGGRSSAINTGRLYLRKNQLVFTFRGWVDLRAHGSVGGSHGKNPQWHHKESILGPSK